MGEFGALLPEGILIGGGVLLVLSQLILSKDDYLVKTTLTAVVLGFTLWTIQLTTGEGWFLTNLMLHDASIQLVKSFMVVATLLILLFANSKASLKKAQKTIEYFFS